MNLEKKKKSGNTAKKKNNVNHETIIVNLIENISRGEVQLSCEKEAEQDFGDYFTKFVFKHYNLHRAANSKQLK